MTPFSVLVTIGITVITSDFHNLILSSNTWKKIFFFAGIISVFWLIYSLWDARKSETIDDIIDSLVHRNQK